MGGGVAGNGHAAAFFSGFPRHFGLRAR